MKSTVWLLLLLSVSMTSSAADKGAAPYLQCAAISYISLRQVHDQADQERYRTAFGLHTKWASWFYPNDPAKYKADAVSVLVALQTDLASKKISAQQLADDAGNCVRLQTRTAVTFMECLKSRQPTQEERELCARRSVGL